MGLSSTVSDVSYAGNNSTVTPYAVPFRFDDNSWLKVRKTVDGVDTDLALGSGFTISGSGSGPTPSASIRTVVAAPSNATIYIYRDTPQTNTFQPTISGGVQPVPTEKQFDKVAMEIQDLDREKLSDRVDNSQRLLGRTTQGPGEVEEIPLGDGLAFVDGKLKNTGAPGVPGPVYAPPGPFVDDVQAAANGVGIGQVYKLRTNSFPRAILTFRQPVPANIFAFIGDSMTDQAVNITAGTPTPVNGVGSFTLNGIGYATQLRRLFNCGFDFVPNGGTLNFATPGYTTGQIRSVHLPQLLASSAQIVCDMSGINDAITNVPLQTTLDNWTYTWTQIYLSGKIPIAIGIAPIGTGYNPSPGQFPNSSGQISARVIALRAAQKALAASLNVSYVDVTGINETQPGNAVADPQYTYDELHQNIAGATRLARAVYPIVSPQVDPSINNFANTNWVTTNANFSNTTTDAYGSRPGPYNVGLPSGAVYSHQLVTDGSRKIWKIQFDTSAVADTFGRVELYNESTAQDPSSKVVENVVSFDLRSGYIDSYRFANGVGPGSTGTGQEWNYPKSPLQNIYPTGFKRTLRTQRCPVSAGISYFNISFSFSGVGELWIYDNEFGTRVYAP